MARDGKDGAGEPRRTIVLVGLMGVGKSTVGRRLAARLNLPFVDADEEIEAAAGMTIAEIFGKYGEPAFRDGERRVIARLIDGAPKVVATGGGAFAQAETRALILDRATAIWLDADIDTLVERVRRRDHRPLLKDKDAGEVLRGLAAVRNPLYAEAHHRIPQPGRAARADGRRDPRAAARRGGGGVSVVIDVPLPGRAYPIHLGAGGLGRLGELTAPLGGRTTVAVVTDATVAALHLAAATASLEAVGRTVAPVILPPGEATKGWRHLEELTERLLALGVERGDFVVALGGGVIGDLAGFAAAILRRGCRFVQVPTTLLSQVDSSVGGKTASDGAAGKNLIGAFHQPSLVVIDPDVLATLPPRELRAGYAEIAKIALIEDAGFFDWLEADVDAVLARDPAALTRAIETAVRAKVATVLADEYETTGRRALLNLGHTFGHALETEIGFSDALLHGEAVAIGCVLAFRLSAERGAVFAGGCGAGGSACRARRAAGPARIACRRRAAPRRAHAAGQEDERRPAGADPRAGDRGGVRDEGCGVGEVEGFLAGVLRE